MAIQKYLVDFSTQIPTKDEYLMKASLVQQVPP